MREVTDYDVAQVEKTVGCDAGCWEMIDPKKLIAAAAQVMSRDTEEE